MTVPAGDGEVVADGAKYDGFIGGGLTIASLDTTIASVMIGISSCSLLDSVRSFPFFCEESLGSAIGGQERKYGRRYSDVQFAVIYFWNVNILTCHLSFIYFGGECNIVETNCCGAKFHEIPFLFSCFSDGDSDNTYKVYLERGMTGTNVSTCCSSVCQSHLTLS